MAPSTSYSDAELLAIVLGIPVARAGELVATYGDARSTVAALTAGSPAAGLTPRRQAKLQAVDELSRRLASTPLKKGQRLSTPEAVYAALGPRFRDATQEAFLVVALSARQHVLHEPITVAIGHVTGVEVPLGAIVRSLARLGAARFIAVHNHPGGDPEPSPQDLALTERLRQVGQIVGIPLNDHVVVGDGSFVSFHARGLI